MITGNKGEWSEIYALFKLLGDTQLFAGDADLNKVEALFYPIIKIIRAETSGVFEYEISKDLVIISGGKETLRLPVAMFAEQALHLLSKIKASKGAAFGVSETEAFMNAIYCSTLKAKSTSKADIRIVIHDQKINQTAELGFSIKSQLGSSATLLNAGRTTNFIYEIIGFTPNQDTETINAIDSRSKIKDRIEAIYEAGGLLKYVKLEEPIFENN